MSLLDIFRPTKKVWLVADGVNWVIKEIACEVEKELEQSGIDLRVCSPGQKLRSGIVHYATREGLYNVSRKRWGIKNILTFYHGDASEEKINQRLVKNQHLFDVIHTSCGITKKHLVDIGIDEKKIAVVPIGIEVSMFSHATDYEKSILRSELEIPENHTVIGSFQKDGNGWDEGNEPKLIKGPDVFCDAVIELHKTHPVFVVLTGPSRGYVKNRLAEAGIPFKHFYFDDYTEVTKYFKVLDLYIVASRLEGGPRGLMESQASGVPIISTRVGMAPEVISHGENGFIAEVGNVEQIVEYSKQLIEQSELKDSLVKHGLETVKRFDWSVVAKEYRDEIYSRVL